jgi:hypothetical protein
MTHREESHLYFNRPETPATQGHFCLGSVTKPERFQL